MGNFAQKRAQCKNTKHADNYPTKEGNALKSAPCTHTNGRCKKEHFADKKNIIKRGFFFLLYFFFLVLIYYTILLYIRLLIIIVVFSFMSVFFLLCHLLPCLICWYMLPRFPVLSYHITGYNITT